MTTKLLIRPATAQDVSAICEIAEATELFPPEMAPDMMAGHLDGSATEFWFVAEAGDICAFGYLEAERMTDGTWNLLALAVSPDQQGIGVGGQMVGWAERHLAEQHARLLLIETADTPDFAPIRAFYAGLEYTAEASIAGYYEPGVGKVIFTKAL